MKFWITTLLLVALNAHANSFVGNGGSEGDVELSVTMMQIRETLSLVVKKSDEKIELCTCNRMFKGRSVCEPLASLTEEQAGYCTKELYQIAPALLKVVENPADIHINWTNAPIEVMEDGRLRAADAVANREKHEITINQPRFLSMKPVERVFLVSHELMHFVSIDGKPLEDRGAIGPFPGDDGSRTFINSMAAAASVMQGNYPKEIKRYSAKLSRSQAWNPFWVTLDFGSSSPVENYTDKFQLNQYSRGQLNLRYQWTNWGVALSYRKENGEGKVLDTINIREQLDTVGAGVTYRIFTSSDALSFWGQAHIMLQLMAEYFQADYQYWEEPIFVSGKTSGIGGSLAVNYMIPLFYGMWTYVGVQYQVHPYKYSEPDVNLNYDKNLISGYLGVGYAF